MADTLNDSLVKVTEELKEANIRSLEASKELGKVTAASKASYTSIGAAVKESVGFDKLKDTFANLPGMNVAKAAKDVIMKKRREKQEQVNLAKRLGITSDQLQLQKAEQEVILARREESAKLIEAAEKLGFNTDRIAKVNEEGKIELNGSLRESNGQFVSKTNASADANLRALKDFSKVQEKEVKDNSPEPKTKREDFSPVEETSLDKTTLEKLATEDTLMMVADKMASMVSSPSVGGIPSVGGAAASEDAGEERRITEAQLGEQEKQTSLLQQLVDGALGGKEEENKKGGFLEKLASLRLALMGLPALLAGKLAALKLGAKAVAGTVVRGVSSVAKGAVNVAKTGASVLGNTVRSAAPVAKGLGKGLLRGAASAARFAGPIGLAVTAAMGIFDGMSAGIEEYKKSGKLGLAVKEGIAGAASGLTFGLVSQESISAGMTKIGTFFSDGWTSFTDGVGKVAGGIAAFAKDPAGTMSAVGESISTKFTETVTSIKDSASALNTKFAELTGIDIGAGFTATVGLIKDGATALGNKFTELTGIEIPTDFASLKTSIVAGAAVLGTKFTELTGIDIGESLTGVKDSILGLGTKISEKFNGLFGEEGFSVAGVKTAISGIGSAISGKFTELTGVELPTFEDVKAGIAGIGASISGGLAALGVPTFSEVTGKMGALATGLAERVGIELPTFDEAKSAVSGLAAGLGSKISSMWDSVTGLFKTADKKQEEIDKANALQSAEDSGMFTDDLGYNTLNVDKLEGASMMQLEAMRDGAALDGKSQKALEKVIASRASDEPAEIGRTIQSNTSSSPSSFDGSTEVRRKNGRIEMMNLDQIDTSLNLRQITNMEANAARNRISEEKSTRPAPPSVSADVKKDVLSAMGNGNATPLGMGSQSIPATVETSALSAMTTASTLTYVPSRIDTNARETSIANNISMSTLQQGASSVMHSDAVQLYTEKTMMLQNKGMENNNSNQVVNIVNANDMSSNQVSAGSGGGGSRPIFSATSGDRSQVSSTLNNRH